MAADRGPLAQVKAGVDAERLHAGRGHRADTVELAHRQCLHEGRPHARGDDEQAVRLAVVGRELGQELVIPIALTVDRDVIPPW